MTNREIRLGQVRRKACALRGEVFRRLPDRLNMRLVIALMASAIVFDGQSGAWAFDFFGLWGSDETPPPVSRVAITYRVTIDVAGGERRSRTR